MVLLTVAYAALFGAISLLRYANFHMGDDITVYAQLAWTASQGALMQITNITAPGDSLWGGHVEPIMLVFALPYRLWPDPRLLLVVQTLALAAGGPLIYALARVNRLPSGIALLMTLFYFLAPHLEYANLHQFHTDPLGVPILLAALLAFDCRRWRTLAVCVGLALVTKETVVLFVCGLGVYWWLARGNRVVGRATILATIIYAGLVMLPWFLSTQVWLTHDYTKYYGDAGAGMLSHLAPGALLVALRDSARWDNLILALLPTGFVWLFDWSAVAAVPAGVGIFLGNRLINDIWFHHYVTFMPIVVYATIRVLARPGMQARAHAVALFLVVWTLAIGYLYAEEAPSQMHWIFDNSTVVATSHSQAQAAFIRGIPDGVSLDADPVLASHLANRLVLYKLWDPREPQWASLILVDLYSDNPNPSTDLKMEIKTGADTVQFMLRADGYKLLRGDDAHEGELWSFYMRDNHGYKLLRWDDAHGLYLWANCRLWACNHGGASG
jgi:uncharacterized membrane protein